MRQIRKLRVGAALLLSAASLTLLTGCGWRGQGVRERGQDKTYIVVVDTKHTVFSGLDGISSELDALLGEGWNKGDQPVIIICQ